MSSYDAWKTSEPASDDRHSRAVEDLCDGLWLTALSVCSTWKRKIEPAGEDADEPGVRASMLEQYAWWLANMQAEDTDENRKKFCTQLVDRASEDDDGETPDYVISENW